MTMPVSHIAQEVQHSWTQQPHCSMYRRPLPGRPAKQHASSVAEWGPSLSEPLQHHWPVAHFRACSILELTVLTLLCRLDTCLYVGPEGEQL